MKRFVTTLIAFVFSAHLWASLPEIQREEATRNSPLESDDDEETLRTIMPSLVSGLVDQYKRELLAAEFYAGVADILTAKGYRGAAAYFDKQSVEERCHAKFIRNALRESKVKRLYDMKNQRIDSEGLKQNETSFEQIEASRDDLSLIAAIKAAKKKELSLSREVRALYTEAQQNSDWVLTQLYSHLLHEQQEEEETFGAFWEEITNSDRTRSDLNNLNKKMGRLAKSGSDSCRDTVSLPQVFLDL